jgi:hypothetical protein
LFHKKDATYSKLKQKDLVEAMSPSVWANASYNDSFKANVRLLRVPNMFLYIIHADMVLNSQFSLVQLLIITISFTFETFLN